MEKQHITLNQKNNQNKIHIVLTSSEYYIPYTCVCLISIIKKTKRNIQFHILSNDISDQSKNMLNSIYKNISYHKVDVTNYPIPKQSRAASIVYSKLFLPTILPDLDRVIVLDSDIIVLDDIEKIWDTNLKDNYVAWVKDPINIKLKSAFHVKKINLKYDYINSGVLLLNLKKYKEDGIEVKIWEKYKDYKDKISFFDQDMLYICLSEKCVYIDYIYNYLPTLEYQTNGINDYCDKNAKIIHYGTDKKPWFYPNSKFANIWWQYARQTPFYEEILARMIDFKLASINPKANYSTEIELRNELERIHFPNINNQFKLTYIMNHLLKFRLKKFYYGFGKLFVFGDKYKEYNDKYEKAKKLIVDAQKMRRFYGRI